MKKRAFLFLALLMAFTLLAGCSPSRDGNRNGSDAVNAELTIYALDSELWWKNAAENFEKYNDDVVVSCRALSDARRVGDAAQYRTACRGWS